jgi:hypothetical protein
LFTKSGDIELIDPHFDVNLTLVFGKEWALSISQSAENQLKHGHFLHTMKSFKHVSYLWDENRAAELAGNEVDLFIYRSNLLGADLRLTNFAGGNTSVKLTETDPVTGKASEVMWVKGSGGDIGTLTRKGCANLYTERLRALKHRYRGLAFEDDMVALFDRLSV